MSIILYEIVTKKDGVSTSPFVIAAELFLKHKGLEFEKIPLSKSEVRPTIREVIDGKWDKVPTVVFPNGDIVFDSPETVKYLDEKYPENSLILKSPEFDALIEAFTGANISGFRMSITDLYHQIEKNDQKYFRESREQRFGTKFTNIPGDREVNLNSFYKGTQAIDKVLENSRFIDGEEPRIHDYALASSIQCYKTISPRTYEEIIVNNPNPNFKRWVGDMDKVLRGYLAQHKTL